MDAFKAVQDVKERIELCCTQSIDEIRNQFQKDKTWLSELMADSKSKRNNSQPSNLENNTDEKRQKIEVAPSALERDESSNDGLNFSENASARRSRRNQGQESIQGKEKKSIEEPEIEPKKMKVVQLREALNKRGLSTSGLKAVLIKRLEKYLEEQKDKEDEVESLGEYNDNEVPIEDESIETEEISPPKNASDETSPEQKLSIIQTSEDVVFENIIENVINIVKPSLKETENTKDANSETLEQENDEDHINHMDISSTTEAKTDYPVESTDVIMESVSEEVTKSQQIESNIPTNNVEIHHGVPSAAIVSEIEAAGEMDVDLVTKSTLLQEIEVDKDVAVEIHLEDKAEILKQKIDAQEKNDKENEQYENEKNKVIDTFVSNEISSLKIEEDSVTLVNPNTPLLKKKSIPQALPPCEDKSPVQKVIMAISKSDIQSLKDVLVQPINLKEKVMEEAIAKQNETQTKNPSLEKKVVSLHKEEAIAKQNEAKATNPSIEKKVVLLHKEEENQEKMKANIPVIEKNLVQQQPKHPVLLEATPVTTMSELSTVQLKVTSKAPSVSTHETQIQQEAAKLREIARQTAKKKIEESLKSKNSAASLIVDNERTITSKTTMSQSNTTGIKSMVDMTIPRKPSNLVSGLHSFTSLIENKKQEPNPLIVKQPIGALLLAEKTRLAEEKKAEERKKRKEALVKKYDEQRKQDEAKRLAKEKAEKEAKLKRDQEIQLRKEKETLLAQKRNERLLEMRAGDEVKKKQQSNQESTCINSSNPPSIVSHVVKEQEMIHSTDLTLEPQTSSTRYIHPISNQKKSPISQQSTINHMPSVPETNVYEISDKEDSSSEESDSEDDQNESKKKIPNWAQKDQLVEALGKQSHMNPVPSIFPDFIATCDLNEIFATTDPKKKKKYTKRTSSSNWIPDRPTPREKAMYMKEMGFQ